MSKKVNNYMLKRVLGMLLFVLASGSIMSQNNFPIEPPISDSTQLRVDTASLWHGLYINPTLEAGLDRPYSGSGIKIRFSFDAGAEACYMFSHNLGVVSGLEYQQYKFKYKFSNVQNWGNLLTGSYSSSNRATDTTVVAGYTTDATYTFNVLRIPILLRFLSDGSNNTGFFAEAGVMANVLLGARVTGSTSETEYDYQFKSPFYFYNTTTVNKADITGVTPDASKFNFSAHVSVGVITPIGDKADMVTAFSYDSGLANTGTGANDVVKFNDATYYFYGKNSNYGSVNTFSFELKFIFKI